MEREAEGLSSQTNEEPRDQTPEDSLIVGRLAKLAKPRAEEEFVVEGDGPPTLAEVLEKVHSGDTVLVQSGVQSLGPIVIPEAMELSISSFAGPTDLRSHAKFTDRWAMKAGSQGSLQATKHQLLTDQLEEPCMLVMGGPWSLAACRIKAGHRQDKDEAWAGVAVKCCDLAEVSFQHCVLGGSSSQDCTDVLIASGDATVSLIKSILHHAKLTAVRCAGLASVTIEDCFLRQSVFGISMVENATATVERTRFVKLELAALSAIPPQEGTTAKLRSCSIEGTFPVLLDDVQPTFYNCDGIEYFKEDDNPSNPEESEDMQEAMRTAERMREDPDFDSSIEVLGQNA
mmetsp:Transcript_23980/g.37585  ORF Transcript_23980/g.37585 Transcript_23980/m.37585 type:complete len:344 (-) Transcript_23980:860-1891(-)